MRGKKQSIYQELMKLLLAAFAIAVFCFCVLNYVGKQVIDNCFNTTEFIENKNDQKIQSLQAYVTENEITSNDSTSLDTWLNKQGAISLQIFMNDMLRYDSNYNIDGEEWEVTVEEYYTWESYYKVTFADGEADVFLDGYYAYQYYNYALLAELAVSVLIFLAIVMFGIQKTMKYIHVLSKEIEILEGGNLEYPITIKGRDELSELAEGLEAMRLSFNEQLEREIYVTTAHKQLIIEMSHDLRTPLTSLLMYTEILLQRKYRSADQQEAYIEKIHKKAQQIKKMSDHIFEYSLVGSRGAVELGDPESLRLIFYDLLSDMALYLEERGFSVVCDLTWETVKIRSNADYVNRILDNMTSNILKYADAKEPVMISSIYKEKSAGIRFCNRISVKGSESGEESTKIGLKNVENMMRSMNGEICMKLENGQFEMTILFPVFEE